MRNITTIGSLKITDGVASGFSTTKYILLPQVFDVSGGQDWEMVFKFTTGDDVTSQCGIASGLTNQYFNWCIQDGKTQNNVGDGTNWLVSGDKTFGSTEISPNTTYWIKVNFNGTYVRLYLSTNGSTYNLDWTFITSKAIPACDVVLGQGRALSTTNVPASIDLEECYIKINDKVWWNGKNRNVYSIKTGYSNYTFKKFYDKVLYTCGVANTSDGHFYAYAKTPFKVGDYVYFVGDGSTQATSESDLTQSTSVYITECDDDSFVTEGMVFNGNSLTIGFGAYKKGNLTTPVKSSYLLYRR